MHILGNHIEYAVILVFKIAAFKIIRYKLVKNLVIARHIANARSIAITMSKIDTEVMLSKKFDLKISLKLIVLFSF